MADRLQAAVDIWRIMSDPCLPSGNSAEGGTGDDIVPWILGVFGNNNVIDGIFDDIRHEMLEPGEL